MMLMPRREGLCLVGKIDVYVVRGEGSSSSAVSSRDLHPDLKLW
jgi:hypothetical protein